MDNQLNLRAAWLARHVLPYEEMLRKWLTTRPLGGLEIDDIIQESYAILAALETVENIRNPRSYLFQIAHSVVHAHFRRSRIVEFQSFTEADSAAVASDEPSPEREVSDREFLREVQQYMDELPKNCREVVILRRVHKFSHREIAQRLGISENSVEKLLFKATQLLMTSFGRGGKRTAQTSTSEEAGELPTDKMILASRNDKTK